MFSLGEVPFSSTSEWNQVISPEATYTKLDWPESTGYNYSVNWDQYSPAVYIASPSDPLVEISVPDSWGHPGGTVSVRMPRDATGAVGTDGELLIIDGDTVYNFWQFDRTSATTATASAYGWTDVETGTGWGTKSPLLGAGTTAIGSSQLSGLLVEAETDKGQINHALQLVVDQNLVKPGFTGDAISGDGPNPNGIVKEGDHLGIPPGTPMPDGLSPLGQQVFQAMQEHGAYVVDIAGGVTVVRAQANAYDAATMEALWHDMGSITPLLQQVTGGTVPAQTPPPPTEAHTPTILSTIAASGAGISDGNGDVSSGTVHLELNFSDAVDVSGTPTLTLNDGGVATYVSGAGTNTLMFDYEVAAGHATSDLAVSAFDLAGVTDLSGKSVDMSGAPTNPPGTLSVGTTATSPTTPTEPSPTLPPSDLLAPTVESVDVTRQNARSGTITLNMSEDVVVSGTPVLRLEGTGRAVYQDGSGSDTLTFSYRSREKSEPSISKARLPGSSSISDLDGNAADLSGAISTKRSSRGVASSSGAEADAASSPEERSGSTRMSNATSTREGRSFASENAFDLPDMASNFRTTLAFKPNDRAAALEGADSLNAAKLQLLGQYMASSFPASGTAAGATTIQDANASGLAPTLTRSS